LAKPSIPSGTNAPNDILIEELTYVDDIPWDANADGTGESLHRVILADAAADPTNWEARPPTPGNTATVITNTPPVLTPIAAQSATAGSLLQFGVNATDANSGQTITYSLVPGGPSGTSINPSTGLFTWTPTAAGTFTVTIVATDDGMPPESAQETVMITVIGANSPPILNVPGTVYGVPGMPLTFTATATDPDPGQSFAFAAFAGPAGGAINPSNGQYSWTPTAADLGTQTVTVAVADNGNPAGSDTAQVKLVVTSSPLLAISDLMPTAPASFRLAFPAAVGTTYRLETSVDIENPMWVQGPLLTASSTLGSFDLPLNNPPECLLFYRILALP